MPATIKNRFAQAGAVAALLVLATTGYADKIHQEDGIMNNHSTEYVRMLNRNASTDADAAFYNPAGLAFMAKNGLYINFSSQTYHVKRAHTMDFYAIKRNTGPVEMTPHKLEHFIGTLPDEYSAELTAPVLPGFDVVWKQDKWAAYFDLAVMQAATDMTFDRGLAILDWGNLIIFETNFETDKNHFVSYSTNSKAIRNEMYLGFTFGGAYQIKNWLSAGGGLRVISASGNMKVQSQQIRYYYTDNATGDFSLEKGGDWDIDTDSKGMGYGIILSTHFNAGELVHALRGLNAALRCEYYLPMELEKTTNKFVAPSPTIESGNLDIFMDGSANPAFLSRRGTKTLKATYPPTVNLGLSYLLLGWINLASSGQVTFRRMIDLDGRENDFNVGYQAGFGAEFILNDKITLSAGYLYNDFGVKPEARTEADQMLRSHTVGGGGKFTIDDNLVINLGAFYQYFVPATNYEVQYTNVTGPTWSYLKKEFRESRYSVSFGVTYRMLGGPSENVAEKSSLSLPRNDAKRQ
jgi:long-chain fatty acid transport protein